MPTADDVLNVERRWLNAGTHEIPDGSNHVPGITDQPGRWNDSWCDMFQNTCFLEAGVPTGPGRYGSASVSTTFNWYRAQGRTFVNRGMVQKGDLVAYNYAGGGPGYDHIGMVESVRSDGIVTIEGNTHNAVRRNFRSWNGSGIVEFARPLYNNTPSPPGPSGAVYSIGSRGEFVKSIQKVVGVAQDGVYGPQTYAAVKVWQGKLHITQDGVWGPATQAATAKFFDWINSINRPPPSSDPNNILQALLDASKTVLKVGSSGPNVKILQQLLINKGFSVAGGVDGQFGPGTYSSVKRFQASRGLIQDGVVGARTWSALLR